ncbi:hypothetical protein [Ralstonia sp. 24A2]|uniref:hypothetical protein n=1 Tax=Ralstonia sp. 24A2 TaxID=3447364 RepID=UPI003F6A483F
MSTAPQGIYWLLLPERYSPAGMTATYPSRRHMTLKFAGFALLLSASSLAQAQGASYPKEVKAFIAERDTCEHFRGEPSEGNSPEQIERRQFIADSLDIYCAGTDKRLAALKRRYQNNRSVMKQLNRYEARIE